MQKLTRASLALNGLSRCFVTEKHLSAIKITRRGLVCADHGNDVYDIIISGGGMVGSAMACSLGECSTSVARLCC